MKPTANSGDTGSIPGPGRSDMLWDNQACVPQLPSLCSRALKPQPLSACATTSEAWAPYSPSHTMRSHHNEKPVHYHGALQLQKALTQQQRPSTVINEQLREKFKVIQDKTRFSIHLLEEFQKDEEEEIFNEIKDEIFFPRIYEK